MPKKNTLLESLIPFLILGISVVVFIAVMVLLSYVLIWGLVIGAVLWSIFFIKEKLFPSSQQANAPQQKGRVIDYDEIDK